jgi:Co/Zn/Cd efflux system component
MLRHESRQPSLNIQGAFRQVLTDPYGFIGTAAAGIIILATSAVTTNVHRVGSVPLPSGRCRN